MKTIRILLYTDIEPFEVVGDSLSISDAQRFIQLKLKNIAHVEFTIRNRHYDYEKKIMAVAATKLTAHLLSQHDELWVFCFGNEDTKQNPGRGLDDDEVRNLYDWMKTGGVMVTGDHSQPQGTDDCVGVMSHNEFFTLGSPIGHRIPRANKLRVWKGPPTNCIIHQSQLEKSDIHNTLEEGTCKPGLLDPCLQRDDVAQRLVNMPPQPHFLFFYGLDANNRPISITRLPDHQHEGKVLIPDTYDNCWPARPPIPEFVAFGRDKRFTVEERIFPLVVAYDGDDAGVGRIVADTSFHHFINLNLEQLRSKDTVTGNPVPGTDLDQVAQFHANLAYWLAPKSLRSEIKNEMRRELFFRAATHLDVFETIGNGAFHIGRVAKSVLESEVGVSDLFRIVGAIAEASEEGEINQFFDYALVGKDTPNAFGATSQEVVLGSVIEAYHEFFKAQGINPLNLREDPTPPALAFAGLENAFRTQLFMAEGMLNRFASFSAGGSSGDNKLSQEINNMESENTELTAPPLCGGRWGSNVPANGAMERGEFILTIDSAGNITGTFDGAPIAGGTCTGNRMTIFRAAGGNIFVYDGIITAISSNFSRVRGTRTRTPGILDADGAERALNTAAFSQDEWVAEKGGIIGLTKTEETPSE